nr:transglutaminase-like cysteine peptidase [Enterovirga rhinocerotis]
MLGGQTVEAQTYASLPSQTLPAATEGEARPIQGWVDFCRRMPSECAFDPDGPAVVQLTARNWATMVSINNRVNNAVTAMTDEEHWGVADRWDLPTDGAGDCEDFQILKRHLLAKEGFPRRAMRMTVVIDGEGEGHAVLMIRTDRGDYILDNKRGAILPWFQTGYVYVKRESEHRLGWASLGRAVSPTITANR